MAGHKRNARGNGHSRKVTNNSNTHMQTYTYIDVQPKLLETSTAACAPASGPDTKGVHCSYTTIEVVYKTQNKDNKAEQQRSKLHPFSRADDGIMKIEGRIGLIAGVDEGEQLRGV